MLLPQFVIERLENAGLKHAFGVPGDYVLEFYRELSNSKIRMVNTTDEAHAGFAADAYARVTGLGCVVVTYSVGASKVINAVQCAYAERSPLVVISGAPGTNERHEPFLLHHMVRSFNSQKKMFDEITCASVVLDNASTAPYELDRAFEALRYYKRPIYIELPRDMTRQAVSYDVYRQGTPTGPPTDPENMEESLAEVTTWLNQAQKPAILAGVEIARYGLADALARFAEQSQIPVASTYLSKSVIDEQHPFFAGVYSGSSSQEKTRRIVDDSDCLLMFGDCLTDISLCFRPAKFKKRRVVWANVEGLKVRNHTYTGVPFVDFCQRLFRSAVTPKELPELPPRKGRELFVPEKGKAITTDRLFAKIDSVLDTNVAVCADIGDAMFGASTLRGRRQSYFLSPAYYTSMGTAIPYALGLMMARPGVRPLVIVGDGAFQMSCTELSAFVARKLNPVIIVLNNDGYTTERFLLDGPWNDLHAWRYHQITELLGGGQGVEVRTECVLNEYLDAALASKQLFVLNVILNRKDISEPLRRMTEGLSERI